MKKRIMLVIVLFFGLSSAFVVAPINNTCILDEKYQPRWGEVTRDVKSDFLKAIWEPTALNSTAGDGIIQDFHIVIENCEVVEFYPSSRRFKMSLERYNQINDRISESRK